MHDAAARAQCGCAASIAPALTTIEVIVRRNDTLDALFRKLELSLADLADVRALGDVRALLDRLMPGESLRLTHRDGAPARSAR